MRPSGVSPGAVYTKMRLQLIQQAARTAQRTGQVRADVDVVFGLGRVEEHVVEGDDFHHLDGVDLEDLGEFYRTLR